MSVLQQREKFQEERWRSPPNPTNKQRSPVWVHALFLLGLLLFSSKYLYSSKSEARFFRVVWQLDYGSCCFNVPHVMSCQGHFQKPLFSHLYLVLKNLQNEAKKDAKWVRQSAAQTRGEGESQTKKIKDILPQTNIRSVKGNNLKLHPFDSLDIWLALFLLRHIESQQFSSIQEENEWHQPFVLWAQALISALFWNFNISDHLKQIVCLCIYIEWKPAVCFRKVFSFAYVCPNYLTGKTSPLFYVTVYGFFPLSEEQRKTSIFFHLLIIAM